jgi:transcriptional regulator with GAF, ATPase, and Fis domain/tetratricopeptide (TPR) repeat protein
MERFAGRYTILRPLGSGGMGSVDLALDRANGRECALKRLRTGAFAPDPESLRREFEVLSRIRHPLVVQVLDFGHASADGTPWYTMEYVPGAPLHADSVSRDWRRVAALGAQIATGLEALHAHGIVHGDLKPGNILALRTGDDVSIRLVDFGLAAVLGRDTAGRRGTPGFVAPEVAHGAPQSVASDLYGLGAVLFERVTGRVPGPDGAASDLAAAGVPEALARWVLRLLAAEPAERPADAREVRRALEELAPAARRGLAGRLGVETLIGRARELGEIERWLAGEAGTSRILFLAGEAGVGRSAVLAAVAARAALTGGHVCRLSCAAFSERELPAAIVRHLAVAASLEAEPAGADPEAVIALGAEAGRALERGGKQVLVLLDDAERVEPAARAGFRRLALHPDLDAVRWLAALAGAPEELGEDVRLLVASEAARLLPIGPLDRASADRLVASRLQGGPPTGLCEALWERTGGHPGLMIETLRAAAGSGALRESDERVELDARALAALPLPRTLEEARRARFDALGAGARSIALLLAAVGRGVPEAELGADTGVDRVEALADLAGAGLAHRDEEGRWRLSPPGLAGPLLAALPDEARRAHHARALERVALGEPERFEQLRGAGRVAEALACADALLEQGEDERLAVAAARLAGESARGDAPLWQLRAGKLLNARGRYAVSVPFLEAALASGSAEVDRPLAWTLLASAVSRVRTPQEATAVIERAMNEGLPPHHEGIMAVHRAAVLDLAGDCDAAAASRERARDLALQHGDAELMGWACYALGIAAFKQVRYEEARRLAEASVDAFESAGDDAARIRALGVLALTHLDIESADPIYVRALAEARRHDLRPVLSSLLSNRVVTQVDNGRVAAGRESALEVLRLSLEEGWESIAASAMTNLVCHDVYLGELARARREYRTALRLVRAYLPTQLHLLLRAYSRLLVLTGYEREARRTIARARKLARGQGVAWCLNESARHLARRGRLDAARSRCVDGLAAAQKSDVPILVQLHSLLGRIEALSGHLEEGAAQLELCRAALGEWRSPLYLAFTQQLEAALLLAGGDTDEGMNRADMALAGFAQVGHRPDRVAAEVELAGILLGRGGNVPAKAGAWLADAIATCARLGDHALRERALDLELKRLRRVAPGAPARPTGDLIRSVGKLISSLSDLSQLSQRAMVLAVEQLGAERGVLLLLEDGAFVPVAEHGTPKGFSGQVVERVAKSGNSLLIADAPSDPSLLIADAPSDPHASETMQELRSILCVPMAAGGRFMGAVYLDDSRRPGAFTEADRRLLENFAELVALAIDKSRGHEAVQRENELLVGENLELRRCAGIRYQSSEFIARSAAMQDVLAVVERAAQVSSTVLITGDNGTGKELVARILHHSGKRRSRPFVAINCGAIPPTLIESELFGILPSVATGVKGREGRFVEADGGTLFLDEIGEMPPAQQVALLSVLSNREVTPVGGGRPTKVDVRIIAATNLDLRRRVEEGSFREDLFYRLNVIPIEIPPLHKRKADIPALARHFAANFAAQQEREVPEFSADFMATLMKSQWPGNVRELQNYIERVMAMTPGRTLRPKPLPQDLTGRQPRLPHEEGRSLVEMVVEYERRLIERALVHARGNQTRAAEELGITEHALRYRIKKLGLPGFRKYRQNPRK